MKNKFFITLTALVILSLTSCKKDWECYCVTSLFGEEVLASEIKDFNKRDAEDACKNLEKAKSYEECRLQE